MRNRTIAIVLLIILFTAAKSNAWQFMFNRFQVHRSAALFNSDGSVLPFTVYVIPDKNNDATCLVVLVDNATRQFNMSAVDSNSCKN